MLHQQKVAVFMQDLFSHPNGMKVQTVGFFYIDFKYEFNIFIYFSKRGGDSY